MVYEKLARISPRSTAEWIVGRFRNGPGFRTCLGETKPFHLSRALGLDIDRSGITWEKVTMELALELVAYQDAVDREHEKQKAASREPPSGQPIKHSEELE